MNFWNDAWCGESLSQQLNIPSYISEGLQSCVSDYIINDQWSLPTQFVQMESGQMINYSTVMQWNLAK